MVATLQKNIKTVTNNDAVSLFGVNASGRGARADADRIAEILGHYVPRSGTREELATIPADKISDGALFNAGGLLYVGSIGATAIPDLPGWLPLGDAAPEHFGASRDGASDCSLAFQSALNWMASDASRKLVDSFSGVRVFNTPLTTVGHVNWDAGNAVYEYTHSGNFLSANGNASASAYQITADYVRGAREISVALPAVPQRGDWLRIVSNAVNPQDRSRIGNNNKYRIQEFVQVDAGSTSSVVKLMRPLRFDFGYNDAEDTVIDSYTIASNTRVVPVDASIKFSFKGGTIRNPEADTVSSGDTFSLVALSSPLLEGIEVSRSLGAAFVLVGTLFANVRDCFVHELPDPDGGDGASQNGYGVRDGGEFTAVENCRFGKCRHAYTTLRVSLGANTASYFSGGNTVGGKVTDCTAFGGTTRPFDTHHGAYDITFERCHAQGMSNTGSGATYAFGNRGVNTRMIDCTSRDMGGAIISQIESVGLAGNNLLCRPTVEVINGCFEAFPASGTGEIIYAIGGAITLSGHVRVKTNKWRQLIATNGRINVAGVLDLIMTSDNGRAVIDAPTTSYLIAVTLSGAAIEAANPSIIVIEPQARLNLDLTELTTVPTNAIALVASTCKLWLQGLLSVKASIDGIVFSASADTERYPVGLRPIITIEGPAAGNFNIGPYAGRVTYGSAFGA